MDSNVYQMVGNPAAVKKLTQTLNINGNVGDTFTANLWATGFPTTFKDQRTFGIEVQFIDANGDAETFVSNFNSITPQWQFLSDVFEPQKAFVKAYISIVYSYNCNYVRFDGLSLYREDHSSSYEYDDKGNLESVQNESSEVESFLYDTEDNVIEVTDSQDNRYQYSYDTSHNVTSAVFPESTKDTFQYDSYGNLTESKIVDPEDETNYIRSTSSYSANGNYLTSETDPLGNTISYTYDENKGLLTKNTDAKNQETSYTYDTMERLTGVTTQVGDANAQVSYTYEDDSLKSITHNGFQYSFTEDGFGNNTSVSVAGTEVVRRTYENGNGNLASETYANGCTYFYEYDKWDRITEIRLQDQEGEESVLYRYEYDHEGNLSAVYDIREDLGNETSVTRYYYDISGRLSYMSTDGNVSSFYEYGERDLLTDYTQKSPYREHTITYAYDDDDRETSTVTGSKTYATVYDPLGRITSRTWDTTVPFTTTYTYQDGAEGSSSTQVQTISNNGSQILYTYDANNNITSITSNGKTITYQYDELNQLILEDNGETTIEYSYDLGGNITEKRIMPYVTEVPNPDEEISAQTVDEGVISYTYDTTWKDQLVSYNGETITYDAIGNPLTYRGMTLDWEKERELGSITKDGATYQYRYDQEGMRDRKILSDGTIHYQMEGDLIIGEWKLSVGSEIPSYELQYVYDSSGELISMLYNGTQYYYVKNLQGDIIGIIDGVGTTVVTYVYDSWGKLLEVGGSNPTLGQLNPFRYRGYYYDNETGFYYLKSRYYDPEVGRFLNADDFDVLYENQDNILENNLFCYCFNNPVNMYDASGESALVIAGVCITVAVFTYVYTAYHVRRRVKTTRKYTVSKSYWNSHSHSKYRGYAIIAISYIYKAQRSLNNIYNSKKTSKKSGKETANNPPGWAKREKYDKNKTADQNAADVLNKKYGKGNWKKGADTEYNKIKKWLQRSKGYK